MTPLEIALYVRHATDHTMKTTPEKIPPKAGVYVLIHRASQSIYIGSSENLRNRFNSWRSAFKHPNYHLQKIAGANLDPAEWEFRVVKIPELYSTRQVRVEEQKLIDLAKAKGMTVRNTKRAYPKKKYMVQGVEGSVRNLAHRFGVRYGTVLARLEKGMSIEEALGL